MRRKAEKRRGSPWFNLDRTSCPDLVHSEYTVSLLKILVCLGVPVGDKIFSPCTMSQETGSALIHSSSLHFKMVSMFSLVSLALEPVRQPTFAAATL
jgi:hypothetical protein